MIRKSLSTIFMVVALPATTLTGSPIDPITPAQAQNGGAVTGKANTFFAHVPLSLIIVPSMAILAFVYRNKRDLTRKKELKKMTPTASALPSAPDPLPEPPKETFDHEAAKKILREFRERQRSL